MRTFGLLFAVLGAAILAQPACSDAGGDGAAIESCDRLENGSPDARSPLVSYSLGGALALSGGAFELAGSTGAPDDDPAG